MAQQSDEFSAATHIQLLSSLIGTIDASSKYDYVILGGGNAGGYACKQFVDSGITKDSKVCMISTEAVLPYERPALSKGYLLKGFLKLPMFNTCAFLKQGNEEKYYEENNIDVKLGTTITDIDFAAKSMKAKKGDATTSIAYNKLLLATGCGVVKFSDFMPADKSVFKGVYYLRDIEDARAIKSTLNFDEAANKEAGKTAAKAKKSCVIVGGGYIGMEIAAALLANAVFRSTYEVTMLFPEPHMMEARKLFNAAMGAKYHALYEANGVKFLCNDMQGIMVARLDGDKDGNVSAVVLKNGTSVAADMVFVGIGARPNTTLFKDKLKMSENRGLEVNKLLQSSNGDVYGCGDIMSFPCPYADGKPRRFEHVRNARASAMFAVKAMAGKLDDKEKAAGYEFLPVFYSRVFGQGWEYYGESGAEDSVAVYAKDEEKGQDTISDRQFKLCAVWSNKADAVTAIFVDTDEAEDKKKAEELVAKKANFKEVESLVAAFGERLPDAQKANL